ncbi:ABC transporter permease [Paenibacillus sepulcri]|uniref:ABC transporter permease n=2 Tax=Paenibacillus sepulcri TaxID=359917 RepID=A0ABS7C0R0_9BACL|nr:ABC transporter permease [Paenibacillus sepulcri]
MKIWFHTAYYGFLRYIRNKSVVVIMLVLPLLLIFLLGSALSGEMKPVKIVIYNADNGEMNAALQTFTGDPALSGYAIFDSADTEEDLLNRVRGGGADYGIEIPANFSELVQSGGNAQWKSYPGPDDLENQVAESILNRYLGSIQTAQTIGIVMTGYGGASENHSAAESFRHDQSVVTAGLVGGGGSEYGKVSAIQYYAGTYLIMFLLYSGMSAALSLLDEKESGTLGRLYSMPQRWGLILAGRLTSIIIFAAIQSAIIILFSWLVYGVDWGGRLGQLAVVCLLTSACAVGLSLIIASIAKTKRATQSIFSTLAVLMTFLSGGMIADLGEGIKRIGSFTINHWAVVTIGRLMDGEAGMLVWKGVGILAAIATVLMTIALLRMKKVVSLDA